jgi:predicted NACHT family NTPase
MHADEPVGCRVRASESTALLFHRLLSYRNFASTAKVSHNTENNTESEDGISMFDWGTIGGGLLKGALPKVVEAIVRKINSKLNPSELEKTIKEAIASAKEQDDTQLPQKRVFYYCDDKQTDKFLAEVFKSSGVQEELEKPLKDGVSPNIPLLVEAFKRVAQNVNVNLNIVSLEVWIRKFTETYFQQTNAYLKYEIAKKEYLYQLIIRLDKIDFAGIDVRGQERDKLEKLENIFVMPHVLEKQPNEQIIDDNQKGNRAVSATELLSQSHSNKLVILGEPGSGKSTLMKYFAVKLAQQQFLELGLAEQANLLPILIRIRELAKHPENNILVYLENFIPLKFSIEIPKGFFDYWLQQGKAVILLDGLDEIAASKKRNAVIESIYALFNQDRYAQNRVIITSRPAGYKRELFLTEEFPHYQILPFDEDKINLFIQQWHNSRFPDPTESKSRQKRLKNILKQQERIKLLVRNPLLLTLIVLIHRYDGYRLPQRRHKVYDVAVETLLTSWERNIFDDDEESILINKLTHIKFEDLRPLMERVAYWAHSLVNNDNEEGYALMDRNALIKKLSDDIKKLKAIDELYQAEQEASNFIDYISERSGLLNEQGQDCYAFVHKTFQEYLCAKEINYQARNERDFEIVLKHIQDYLYDPHWREVLLLLIAIQEPNNIATAIKAILEHAKENEPSPYHNLLLAGSCLAEDPQNLKSSKNDPSKEILNQLVELELNNDSQFDNIRSLVFQTLCSLSQTEFAAPALELLESKKDLIAEERMEEYRSALGKPKR